MMKKIVKFFILVSICICFFPLNVYAVNNTYVPVSGCTHVITRMNSNNVEEFYGVNVSGNDVRGLLLSDSRNYVIVGLVSESPFTYSYTSFNTSGNCNVTASSASTVTVNGHSYYLAKWQYGSYQSTYSYLWPCPTSVNKNYQNSPNSFNEPFVNYTFGNDAVAPGPDPINWGSLRDLSYTTVIAGGGSAAVNNKDILSWDTLYDTNYNDISGEFVKIRVLKGSYQDSTKADLLTQAYNALIHDTSSYNILGTYPVSQGKVSYQWSYIMNRLDYANIGLMLAHPEDNYWIKKGWIYQAQLIADDGDYEGEWQTLYTGTSASAKASEVLINSTNYDIDVYQVIQQITEANNNTSITITYIDTDITIQNPSDGNEPSGGTNLWDILKELVSGIFQIIAKLGDMVGNLIDGILGLFQNLFTPPEVDQQINNDINIQINSYLEDDQPGLNDIHTNIDTWKLQLEDIASDYASGGDCILSWDDVSMNLSVFGAGNVTFIPAGTYDLKTAFLNLLTGFGVSYSTYQMLVSAVIYISLIVLISHKVKGFLKT